MYYINTIKQELSTAKTHSFSIICFTRGLSLIDFGYRSTKFGVFVYEDHSKLHTLYGLLKQHNRHYKSRFIANSSS